MPCTINTYCLFVMYIYIVAMYHTAHFKTTLALPIEL